jgi:GNAT superfamily N-acetyltransferase
MNGDDQLVKAASESAQDGDIAEPTALAAVVSGLAQPLQALQNEEQAHELFAAFDNDFGFIRFRLNAFTSPGRAPIQPADEYRYASLLRWLIRELRNWRRAEDPRYEKLVAAFVVAQICDSQQGLWHLLPNDIGGNADLLDDLARLVGSFAVAFNARPGAKVPIWESEAVEEFKRADAAGDWVAVIRGWQHFRHQSFFANTLQTQAVRMLYRFSFERLGASVANVRQTPVAMQLAGVLTIEQRLRLSIASNNPYVQIAVMYRTLANDRRPQSLTEGDQHLLTELLLKVADDASRWAEWMKIFGRYPALQSPLAQALVKVPKAAIDGYVASLWLHPKQVGTDAGRSLVAQCLRQFRATASLEQRRALWTSAYERWLR